MPRRVVSRNAARVWSGLAALLLCLGSLPARATSLNTICAPQDDPCVVDSMIAVDDGAVFDLGGRDLQITSSGSLDVGSGRMTIVAAGNISVEDGGELFARGAGAVAGGVLDVRADSIAIDGTVSASGSPPGTVTLAVVGAADVNVTGVVESAALARIESGGVVNIDAGSVRMLGEVDVSGGSEDSLGGDVEIAASGDVRIEGEISAFGSDGGSATVDAGAGVGSGNIVMSATSRIIADAKNQGGFGGSADITASGDGLTTGFVTVDGFISVLGDSAGEEFGGGSGGCLSITAEGDILNTDPAAVLTVAGGAPDGDGGELEIVSNRGRVSIAGKLDVSASGDDGGGGDVSIDALGAIDIFGPILASAGDAGEVALASTAAGVTIDEIASITANGRTIGSGGAVCLESASIGAGKEASVIIKGPIDVDGGGAAGDGGSLDVVGLDSARVTSIVSADGGLGGGLGGSVTLAADGPVFVEGTLRARGRGGSGGSIAIDAARIEVPGSITVEGSGAGPTDTDVGLTASGKIEIAGEILATGSPGSGGSIEIVTDSMLLIAGTLSADGGATPGGKIDARGCAVLLCGFGAEGCEGATGTVRTLGPDGLNRLTGRSNVDVFGTMTAERSGRNEVLAPAPVDDNAFVLGAVEPAAIKIEAQLEPCTGCGNGQVEQPPETCDDGNNDDGDGCSADCQIEDFDLGDVNGDARVDPDDLGFLAREIFDGDGDRIEDVSKPAFAGTPAADTNGDRRITAADFVGLVGVLVGR